MLVSSCLVSLGVTRAKKDPLPDREGCAGLRRDYSSPGEHSHLGKRHSRVRAFRKRARSLELGKKLSLQDDLHSAEANGRQSQLIGVEHVG
jgi:hypothetical protein